MEKLDYKNKWDSRFADNDTFNIGAKDLREFKDDTADTFETAGSALKLSELVWRYIGSPANGNISRGEPSATATYGGDHYYNVYQAEHTSNTYGSTHVANTYGDSHDSNTYGDNHSRNAYGGDHIGNAYGNGHKSNTYGSANYDNTYGDDLENCVVGDGCAHLAVGDGCQRVRIFDCQGTSGKKFTIPAGTLDAEYRNNQLVVAGTGGGTVKTVNGQAPDAAGNVQVATSPPVDGTSIVVDAAGELAAVAEAYLLVTFPVGGGQVQEIHVVHPAQVGQLALVQQSAGVGVYGTFVNNVQFPSGGFHVTLGDLVRIEATVGANGGVAVFQRIGP